MAVNMKALSYRENCKGRVNIAGRTGLNMLAFLIIASSKAKAKELGPMAIAMMVTG